jgi:cytochrome P450
MTETDAQQAAETLAFPFERRCPFDPPEEIARLRETEPAARVRLFDGSLAWLLTRYDDVRAVCRDGRFSSDTTKDGYPEVFSGRTTAAQKEKSLISMDAPKHTQLRRAMQPWFTVKRAEAMRPRIQALVDGLLDDLERGPQPADLVLDFALPIPTAVICWLLGVPVKDHRFFQERAGTRLSVSASPEEVMRATTELMDYLSDLLDQKEVAPSEDLMSDLVHKHVHQGDVTRHEAVDLARVLLIAGHESTANMIALGAIVLLEHPEQLEELRGSPNLIPGTVEELLRYLTIAQLLVGRVATEDVEVAGQLIREGEGVRALINSANRDPRAFEDPDRFDIHRHPRHHVAFGFGVHQCLGQPYARVEMQVALESLIRRLPGLRLATSLDEIEFKYESGVHGVRKLPVRW